MNAELKAKWVTALRSGEYQQGKKRLYDGSGYCCLGVLANLSGLPVDKERYARLCDLMGDNSGRVKAKLTIMNDDEGKTFPEIADWIEANL